VDNVTIELKTHSLLVFCSSGIAALYKRGPEKRGGEN